MRRPTLFVLLVLATGCGKKPEQPAPDINVALAPEPAPTTPPDAPTDRKRPKVALTGDPADPVCAGKKLSEWRTELRAKAGASTNNPRVHVALRVMQLYGPAAEAAVPDIFAAEVISGDENSAWLAALKAVGKPAAAYLVNELAGSPEVVPRGSKPVPALWWKRNGAVNGLSALGPDAAGVVPQLLDATNHPDPGVRGSAISLFGSIGPAAKTAIPVLTEALKDPDPDNQLTAAFALAHVDPGADDVSIPVVVKIYAANKPTTDGAYSARDRARHLLTLLGDRSVRHIAALAKKQDGTPDRDLLRLLAAFASERSDPAAVPGLVELIGKGLGSDDALDAIRAFGSAAKGAIPDLLRVARSGPNAIRTDALYTAARAGAAPEDLVPLLAEQLKQPEPSWNVFSAVHVLGPKAKDLLPVLTAQLGTPNESTRARVAGALGCVDPTSSEACRVLLELKEAAKDKPASNDAWNGLNALPSPAVTGLRPYLDHPKPSTRIQVARLIIQHDPADAKAFKLLVDQICRDEPGTTAGDQPRQTFVILDVETFRALKQAGAGGATRLVELLKYPVRDVRGIALHELASMKPVDIAHTAPALAGHLATADDWASAPLLAALAQTGEAARPHAAVIREAAKRADPRARFEAARVLAALNPEDKLLSPILADLLKPEALTTVRESGFTLSGELAERYPSGQFSGGDAVGHFHWLVSELWFETDPEAAIRGGAFTVPRKPNGS